MALHRCPVCNDDGTDDGCPRCGKTVKTIMTNKMNGTIGISDIIPEYYKGKIWQPVESTDGSFKRFDSYVNEIIKMFLGATIPKFSLFLAAPPKYGKIDFAYTCMQTSLVQGLTVAPLLTSADWKRLYNISQMNPFYKLYDKYQWDILIQKDVVFLTMDYDEGRKTDILLLKNLYETRAHLGLSTFVISDFRLQDLVPRWKSDMYNLIYNNNKSRDMRRYPVVLQRF